ncbi:MAG TPA: type II secretion system secretin GspD [Candidatus Dormibacteraeota bacterium]|nr:type II secretion system secretin GspD [Candidatus Dormibacteraeota bacterium]
MRFEAAIVPFVLLLTACTTMTPSSTPKATRVEVSTQATAAPPATAPPLTTEAQSPGPPPAPPAPLPPSEPAAETPPSRVLDVAPPPPPSAASRPIVLNFDNADVELVIQAVAEIAGFNYVLGPNVRGRKVTVQTVGKIATDDAFNVLLTILDVNGLAAVRTGNLYRIITREGVSQVPLKTVVGRAADPRAGDAEILTQIVKLEYIRAVDAANLLRPFVPAQGAVTAHPETNLLILTDNGANIRRLLEIVKLIDVEVALDDLQVIPIKHADAQELAQILSQLFTVGRVAGAAGALTVPSPGLFQAAPGPASPAPPVTGLAAVPGQPRVPLIVADRRSNSLVIYAGRQERETIRRFVEKLDVDIYGGQRVFIYFAENTKARELAITLDDIYGRGGRSPSTAARQTSGTAGGPTSYNPPPYSPSLPPSPFSGGAIPGGLGLQVEGVPRTADIRFVADEVTNAVIVTTYPRLWKEIEDTIKKLDRMARQVLIEVLAAEVTLTDDTKLGIEWAVRSGRFDVNSSPSGTLPGRPLTSLIPLGGPVAMGLNFFTFATEKFLAALNALASENKVNVLSSPTIMTAENKKAIINVSTSVPIVTSQQVPVATGGITGNSITQTVEYKDIGIILTVTPRIGEQGTVALDVKQEVNDVGPTQPPPINSPTFIKREAETSVVLVNNQTLVLGGLIQNRRTRIRIGVPWFMDIPILGYLFGSNEWKTEKTELLLLITPRVVGTALDAARISDHMRHVTPAIEDSLRQAPSSPPTTQPR